MAVPITDNWNRGSQTRFLINLRITKEKIRAASTKGLTAGTHKKKAINTKQILFLEEKKVCLRDDVSSKCKKPAVTVKAETL